MIQGMVQWALSKCEAEKWVMGSEIQQLDNKRSNITFIAILLQNRSDPKKHQEVVQLKETRFVLRGMLCHFSHL